MNSKLLLCLALVLSSGFVVSDCLAAIFSPEPALDRDAQLQESFHHFPLLTPMTDHNGQPVFQTLALNNPVLIDGTKYYGVRFTVPYRKSSEDFVWSFVLPPPLSSWNILPQSGGMEGFQDCSYSAKNEFPSADALLPLNGRKLILQSLSGDALQDGKTYLIWFALRNHPAYISLAVTFANLRTNATQRHCNDIGTKSSRLS